MEIGSSLGPAGYVLMTLRSVILMVTILELLDMVGSLPKSLRVTVS